MTGPIKFDFSSYAAAIPATPAIQGQENGSRIAKSHESQSPKAKNAELPGETTSPTNRRIAEIAKDYDDFQDDRHHCRECRNLRNSYCTRQRFRLVDDMPRRCEDFSGYPDWIGQSASGTPSSSEAEHNAVGRYFKFLVTWKNGNQCYLCQMPRQTLDEMRAQFPDATHIEPVTGEHYDD
jgi:hypothetical protein